MKEPIIYSFYTIGKEPVYFFNFLISSLLKLDLTHFYKNKDSTYVLKSIIVDLELVLCA